MISDGEQEMQDDYEAYFDVWSCFTPIKEGNGLLNAKGAGELVLETSCNVGESKSMTKWDGMEMVL